MGAAAMAGGGYDSNTIPHRFRFCNPMHLEDAIKLWLSQIPTSSRVT
jgi:hypothetical protein